MMNVMSQPSFGAAARILAEQSALTR